MNFIDRDVRDSLPVIGVSVLMFYIPKDLNFLQSYSRDRKYKKSNYIWIIISIM